MMSTPQPDLAPGLPALAWEPEEFVFQLQYAGRAAGTTRWISGPDRHHWLIRVETNFTGVIGTVRRVQVSKLEMGSGLPVSYIESDGGNGRHFETRFDRKAGLVTVFQHRDEASIALTQDYLDPVSILQYLRTLSDETSSLRVPMIGGTVLVARLPDEVMRAPWGEVNAKVYYLRPGIGLVYIEADAPHRILKLGQTVGKFMLESWLMRAGVPHALPSQVERPRDQAVQSRGTRGIRVRSAQEGRHSRLERQKTRSAESSQSERQESAEPRVESEVRTGRSRRNRRRGNRETQQTTSENRPRQEAAPQPAKPQPAAEGNTEAKRKRRRRRSKRGNARGTENSGGSES